MIDKKLNLIGAVSKMELWIGEEEAHYIIVVYFKRFDFCIGNNKHIEMRQKEHFDVSRRT